MLDRLLDLLRSGGTRRVAELARELGTTPELVEMMLEDLCRKGYLKRVGGDCSGKCAACPMAGLCAAGGAGKLWALTGKAAGANGR
jgi:DNA-binding Lrp family transcriptional regulator